MRAAAPFLAGVLVAMGAGCGGSDASNPALDCIVPVEVDGQELRTHHVPLRRALPPIVGTVDASVLRCEGGDVVQPRFVREGVPASVAVFARRTPGAPGQRVDIDLATDALVAQRAHPLHRDLRPSPPLLDPAPCRTVERAGTVQEGTAFGFDLQTPDRRFEVQPRAGVTVDAPAVDGVPRLEDGTRVVVRGRQCDGRAELTADEVRAQS